VKLRYVGNAPFFSALDEAEQERISQRMHLEHRRSGEALFHKGEDSKSLYLVKSGWVRLLANGGTVLASQGPGSLVGETDLFLERPRSLGATLASDAELWVLTRQDLTELIAETPQIGLKLALAFGSRLAIFDSYLVQHHLKFLPALSGLSDEVLLSVARRLVPVEKKEGEFIVEAGQAPEALFIVESGQVHLHSSEEGGDFSELGQGETFGEMALLTGRPHAHTAQAATDVILWALPAAEFEALTEARPEVRLAFSKTFREPLLAQDMNRAMERLAAMPIFANLSEEVLWSVAQRMLVRHVPAGEFVFDAGSPGDAFYLIDKGQIEIVSSAREGHSVLARLGTDQFFGEMALLTGKPRSMAARAATHNNLWVLYRSDFDDLVNRHPSISLALSKILSERLAEMDRRFTENHLRGLKLLTGLAPSQLEDVSRKLEPSRFRQGEVIIREGDPGDDMFFVETGRVRVSRAEGTRTLALADLGAGDLFGEMALLTGNTRSATVTATSDVDLWVLSRADFDDLVVAYPNLALALSRLLSERLRHIDERFLDRATAPTTVAARPQARPAPKREVQPAVKPEPTVKLRPEAQPARRQPKRNWGAELREAFGGAVAWFGALSVGARVRLVAVAVLLVWLLGIAAPTIVISTLAAEDVTNLQGAVAFVQVVDTPLPASEVAIEAATPGVAAAQEIPPLEAEARIVQSEPTDIQALAVDVPAPEPEAPLLVESVTADTPAAEAEMPAADPPTPTPWIIVVTNTPLPPTDTPLPPTETPVPPTDTPEPVNAAAKPPNAPKPAPTATPIARQLPPRDLDPRLSSLNVQIVDAKNVQPGQWYWRLVKVRWQSKEESGNDHTIYIELLDENGGRVVGQPVEVRWQDGSLTVVTEDKPPNEYPANFPMYNTLGSYSVNAASLPSDTIVGLGMGTADQPNFTIHTNFFLTFEKVKR
jgi:CRP-like cAMP-binding protein